MNRRKWYSRLLCAALLLLMLLPAHADMGPKPSVVINLEHGPESPCYVTLLSIRYSTGPASSIYRPGPDGVREETPSGYPDFHLEGSEYDVYLAFRAYEEQDPDRLYFLQEFALAEDGFYRWGYYPPERFKVLLYFPEMEAFAVTEELLDRYAFDSYFTIDLSGVDLIPGGTVTSLNAVKSYDYTWELISLAARVVLTIGVELAIAWWFGFRARKQLILILAVNFVTQFGLNLALNIRAYQKGTLFILIPFLWMEIGVTLVEWIVYRRELPRLAGTGRAESKKRVLAYAVAANAVSLVLGWILAHVIPGIF